MLGRNRQEGAYRGQLRVFLPHACSGDDDGSDATLKVIRAVVGARSVGCVCCPPEMTVAVGGQFYDSSPSSSTGRWALLLALAYPPERTLSRWDEFAGQLNAIDLSKLKKLLTNLNIRLRTA